MSCLDWERSDQRSDHQLSRLGACRFFRLAQTMSFLDWERSDQTGKTQTVSCLDWGRLP